VELQLGSSSVIGLGLQVGSCAIGVELQLEAAV
jgi:hypothetical protein